MSTVSRPRRNIWHSIWQKLGSIQLAALLLIILALGSLLASLFPQMPADPATREPWLMGITLRYGRATRLLQALDLFDAYHSPWYLALLAALLLNTLFCTLQRVSSLWQSLNHPSKVVMPDAFYANGVCRAEWTVSSLQEGWAALQGRLKQHRYHVHTEREGATAYIYAAQGRWTQVCSPISHVAAFSLVLALVTRPVLSWQDTGVNLLPGEVYSVGHGHDWGVRSGPLAVERHPGGEPRNYRVPLSVLRSGTAQAADAPAAIARTVRMNGPLTFRGVTFHLQSYGPAVQVMTPQETHSLPFADSQTQEIRMQALSRGSARRDAEFVLRVTYQHQGTTLLVEALDADGSLLGCGTVTDGGQIQVCDTPITFHLSQYTVWQVSHDPTFAPAVGAAAMFLIAATISLWVPHRRLWLHVDARGAQMVGLGDWNFEALARRLADTIPLFAAARRSD